MYKLFIVSLSIGFISSAIQASNQELSDIFCEPLLKRISAATKSSLINNNFILQESESIRILKSRDQSKTIAIDQGSRIGDRGSVFLGQIIETREFVACKRHDRIILPEEDISKSLEKLERLYAIVDLDEQSFLIQPLINGCLFSSNVFYDAMKKLDVHQKAKVALTFLAELKFCYERKVVQTDEGNHNIMYDLKTGTVKLIDFSGVAKSILETLDINHMVLTIHDQGRIYDIFDVRKRSNGELANADQAGPYRHFLESLLDCKWSMTEGPNFLSKLGELQRLIQTNSRVQ
jgi:serine/threonine protein kinase